MGLRERKQINNLPHYNLGKYIHMPLSDTAWGNTATGGMSLLTSTIDSFGPVKNSSTMMKEAGTSVSQGSGFSILRQNPVDAYAQMDQINKENTANTLKTAATGVLAGAAFGPIGAGIGGIVGGAIGFIGGASRKKDALRLIEQTRIQTDLNNNYFMGVGQSDYLASQYNLDHNYTQNGQLYGAKDGKLPGYKEGKPDAMVSNGEVVGHLNPSTGQILDAEKVGRGVDFDDTIPKHLGKDTETRSSFVLPQKISPLTGVSPAEYAIETGDVKGGLLMYKDMREYLRYKRLWNGRIPSALIEGYKCGKLPKYENGNLPTFIVPDIQDVINTSKAYQELGGNSFIKMQGLMPKAEDWEAYKKLIGGTTDESIDNYIRKSDDYVDTTGSKRLSTLVPGLLGALGVATAYLMMPKVPKGKPYAPETNVSNPYEALIRNTMSRRRPNSAALYSVMRDAERRGLYALKNLGTSGGRYLPSAIALNIGLQKNWANVLAADNERYNQLLGEQANMDYQLGQGIAQRGIMSNQFLANMLARSASNIKTHRDNALALMLGQAQYGYKNVFDLSKWQDTMGLYDLDYQLRKYNALNGRYLV